jgi:hypothetical protein|tara:strand:- start:2526 stop:3035 length:510 start_codon:yes stop_codon:yes gene_type:complete
MIHSLLSRLGIETWKDIPDYKGIYKASNLGRIRSLKFNKVKYLKPKLNSLGRHSVNLYKNGVPSTNNRISVLMAKAFLNHTPCGHKLVVDHIDNNKINDKLYNIQVITHRENLSKDKKGTSKYTGVSWDKKANKWKSEIRINPKKKWLGYYKKEQEAAQAYQNELKKIT